MASPTVFSNDVIFNGTVSMGQAPQFPDGSIENADIVASAAIDASKLIVHRSITKELAAFSTEPANSTYSIVHIARAAGSMVAFQSAIMSSSLATGQTVSVQLYRSTAGSTFVSVLSSAISHTTSTVVMTPASGTIATSTIIAGDIFAIANTVSSTNAARGLAATMTWTEKYA